MIYLVAFTRRGAALCARLLELLPRGEAMAYAPQSYASGGVHPLGESLTHWVGGRFRQGNALVFVGAAGIAVRACAPYIQAKDRDPAVICIDEGGRHVIPLLSGHLGGANRAARELASLLGGQAVITTATDNSGVFAFDTWAGENGCVVADRDAIRYISAALLEGERVGFSSDFPVEGPLPRGVTPEPEGERGVLISLENRSPYRHTLRLVPRCVTVGLGCRKNLPAELLEGGFLAFLEDLGIPVGAVQGLASIDRKAREPAILALARKYRLPFALYTAKELTEAEGEFTVSDFVERTVGVDNVCERAAVCGGGRLLAKKKAVRGATFAAAAGEWRVRFGGCADCDGGSGL